MEKGDFAFFAAQNQNASERFSQEKENEVSFLLISPLIKS
jgi:hypothetical protein